jgi:hypothetical protein
VRLDSYEKLQTNADGSVDIYFRPSIHLSLDISDTRPFSLNHSIHPVQYIRRDREGRFCLAVFKLITSSNLGRETNFGLRTRKNCDSRKGVKGVKVRINKYWSFLACLTLLKWRL